MGGIPEVVFRVSKVYRTEVLIGYLKRKGNIFAVVEIYCKTIPNFSCI